MRRSSRLILLLFLVPFLFSAVTPLGAAPPKPTRAERKAQKEAIEKLPEKYRQWLRTVELLITEAELESFLALEKDYQRDALIEHFWDARDAFKATSRKELRRLWEANAGAALTE